MAINSALKAWMDEYDAIAREFIDAVRESGVEFGEPDAWRKRTEALVEECRRGGALFRNAEASITSGPISEACIACSGATDSRTFTFSLRCHRDCYFCFNPNEALYEKRRVEYADWRADFDGIAAKGQVLSHVALTGGEPLLDPAETAALFRRARELWPETHIRLYTTGDQLTQGMLEELVDAGMNEIRFSVKPDDPPELRGRTLGNLRMASAYAAALRERAEAVGNVPEGFSNTDAAHRTMALDVMVEMPVLPGDFEVMCGLLDELEDMGAFGINLLEFCYPFNNWSEFERRGYRLKNPPYRVTYNYEYAGSLAVEGSEETCLELVRYALEREMRLGVHYCSLENKHRSQISQQNRRPKVSHPCYKLDEEDFYLKTAKVFGPDVRPVRAFLERTQRHPSPAFGGQSWSYDAEDDCLQFHPRYLPVINRADLCAPDGSRVMPAISYNVLEQQGGDTVLRELKLELAQ